jgi:hypothetical protein
LCFSLSLIVFILFLKTDFADINQVLEPERVIETLQLFPLNPFEESEKLRHGNECRDTAYSYNMGTEMAHPPLDLRLSFL